MVDLINRTQSPLRGDLMQRLADTNALITGSTSNIGRAVALRFAEEGAGVVVSGRNVARGEAVRDEIRAAGGRAEFVRADLDGSKATSEALALSAAEALGGPIDVLVNNAGIFPGGPTADIDEETFDRVFAVNVRAPFFLTAAIAPGMAARGGGAVINLGSWITRLGLAGTAVYASSRAAMETMTRAWAAEFGPSGVRVNALSPGVVREQDPGADERGELLMVGTPAGASGRPRAIADAALYLASAESSFVHGIVLDVDGGRNAVAVLAG
jgi:NAD(P)-dependent dehydrogenase (short-subunit alcohol dehydrogenase family)